MTRDALVHVEDQCRSDDTTKDDVLRAVRSFILAYLDDVARAFETTFGSHIDDSSGELQRAAYNVPVASVARRASSAFGIVHDVVVYQHDQ